MPPLLIAPGRDIGRRREIFGLFRHGNDYPLYPIKVDLAAKKYCRALLRARQEILVKKTEGLYISHRPANSNSLVCFILKLLTAQG